MFLFNTTIIRTLVMVHDCVICMDSLREASIQFCLRTPNRLLKVFVCQVYRVNMESTLCQSFTEINLVKECWRYHYFLNAILVFLLQFLPSLFPDLLMYLGLSVYLLHGFLSKESKEETNL